jgi:hypothetical protein
MAQSIWRLGPRLEPAKEAERARVDDGGTVLGRADPDTAAAILEDSRNELTGERAGGVRCRCHAFESHALAAPDLEAIARPDLQASRAVDHQLSDTVVGEARRAVGRDAYRPHIAAAERRRVIRLGAKGAERVPVEADESLLSSDPHEAPGVLGVRSAQVRRDVVWNR